MDTYIEIVLDNSNSMGNCKDVFPDSYLQYLLPDGKTTRMEVAKEILLKEILPTIDYATLVTVSRFHSIDGTNKIEQPILYSGNNFEAIRHTISEIPIPYKTGGTPITEAVLNAIDRLKKYPNSDRKLILLTDGEETTKNDYHEASKTALSVHGIRCNIFIIGISLNNEASAKAKELVNQTGGDFVNIESSVFSDGSVRSKLGNLKKSIIEDSINKAEILNKPVTEIESLKIRKTIFDDDVDIEIVEDSELNETIRLQSESLLFKILSQNYPGRVKWENEISESGKSFDFQIIDSEFSNTEYYIECKATSGSENSFILTKNEWLFFISNSTNYQLYFVKNAITNPEITKIDNLMKWLISGKVIPFHIKNKKVKAERVYFTIVQ